MSPEAPARLRCEGVTVRFGGIVAVSDVSLTVAPSAIVGLVGPNGAGKSTLFGVVSGLIRPSRGTVTMDGEDITFASPQFRSARGLARTFQHPELFSGLSIRDHLVLAHRAKHQKRRVWSDLFTLGSIRPPAPTEGAEVDQLIELLGLGALAARPAFGLPLGVARVVELGRALASTPRLLLLDEPSSGLDSTETEQFESVLRRVAQEKQISVLLVEHDVDLVMRLSQAVYVLDFGALIASGSPERVRADPNVRSAYLGEEARPSAPEHEAVVGRPQLTAVRDAPASALLEVDDLSVRYGDAMALDGVSFGVGAGRALAILGPNGAGKSSLARAISGLVPACGGRVAFAGRDVTRWAPHRIRRAGLVYLPEGRGVFRSLSVVDNLRMATAGMEGRQARKKGVELALEIFPLLAARRRQPASLLSGGEQQMLSLARALATSPTLLVVDELSLGLAPRMVAAVFDGLATARQAGVTIVMIEQYVHRALEFADDCLVLQRGQVAWFGPAAAAGGDLLRHYLGEAMAVVP